ncbi:MAG: selenocysteine-specific translation elongation factor [Myxococcales bacterium]|nr:selenocysteine-specific translation elongation factor [Myxococcales bacterium]MCB9647306.1 selenocysteine-specific translation elongation factor [Deltaproteobacteria bacterium]
MSGHEGRVIVGTAGHIDHGKTSLIRALTGVDTDRLPEEKRRGITIVLGFAPLTLADDTVVGVVDVPGHEKFVKNMVAGAGGIDVVLMVVAADEGVMPQTREHLEICQLLGIQRGVVALTKVDRAGELAELAVEDVRAEVAHTFLADAPIVPCSAVSGEGLDAVRSALTEAVRGVTARRTDRPLLLPVDRAFSVKGFGTVITGTLVQGQLRVGDTVDILPARRGQALERGAKVRGLQVFGAPVETAFSGQRTAVNLQGVELAALEVGQNLLGRGVAAPTRRLSVQVQHLSSRKKKLKTGSKVVLHTGTALVEAGITLLDADALEPGERGLATLRLTEPVATLPGQRFILRGFEASERAGRTLGGGVVLDPEPPRRRRRRDETLEVLATLSALVEAPTDPEVIGVALKAVVEERGPAGLPLEGLSRRLGISAKALERAVKATKGGVAVVANRAVGSTAVEHLAQEILQKTAAYHAQFPFRSGASLAELTSGLARPVPGPIVELAAGRLSQKGRVVRDGANLRLPEHKPHGEADDATKEAVLSVYRQGGLQPPMSNDPAVRCDLPDKSLKELLASLVRQDLLVPLAPGLFLERGVYDGAVGQVRGFIAEHDGITTQQAKTLLGDLPRKFLIPLLEAMDKRGATARVGEVRKAR